jgi:hypothetical protein
MVDTDGTTIRDNASEGTHGPRDTPGSGSKERSPDDPVEGRRSRDENRSYETFPKEGENQV